MKAVVMFSGTGVHWLAPVLKRGFRHVAVAVQTGNYWVGIDPRRGTPDIQVLTGGGENLAAHYAAAGLICVETEVADIDRRAPLALANCVGAVKAVLGVRAPLVFTPYQLFRHLQAVRGGQ